MKRRGARSNYNKKLFIIVLVLIILIGVAVVAYNYYSEEPLFSPEDYVAYFPNPNIGERVSVSNFGTIATHPGTLAMKIIRFSSSATNAYTGTYLYSDADPYRFRLFFTNEGNLQFRNDGSGCTLLRVDSGAPVYLEPGKEYHVAVVWNEKGLNDEAVLYLNGNKISTQIILDNQLCGSGQLNSNSIGSLFGTNNFPGTIKDVRIYNRALSESEISELAGIVGNVQCTDSDDGINYYVKGSVSGLISNIQSSRIDRCGGPDPNNYLVEYYCQDNNIFSISQAFLCQNGCLDGACVSENFFDFNVGEDRYIFLDNFRLKDSEEDVNLLYGNGEAFLGTGKNLNLSLKISDSDKLVFNRLYDEYFISLPAERKLHT